jgi:hypothetical protein
VISLARKSVHTVPRGKGWGNLNAGKSRVGKIYPTKAAAQKAGRAQAKRNGAEHVIHNKNGRIGVSNSYGGDPFPLRAEPDPGNEGTGVRHGHTIGQGSLDSIIAPLPYRSC